jgi:hypothetical protein
MARKKVSTIMEATLFHRAKLEAARQRKPLSTILEEALTAYLSSPMAVPGGGGSRVEASWGVIDLPSDVVREIMEEEDGWLDT